MKKSNYLLVLLAAAAATACTSESLDQQDNTAQDAQTGPQPVNFSAYINRKLTRGGVAGELTGSALKNAENKFGEAGFGVFAYYTNAEDYASDLRPNFMFNQQVKWNGTYNLFDYSPVRYWPNEHGPNAQSEDIDKVSFFAYAPYVGVTAATGYLKDPGEYNDSTTWGITGTTRNTYSGDPLVKYITAFDVDKSVDLCWGVFNDDAKWETMNGNQTVTKGRPWLNVQHAKSVSQRLTFHFLHATARLNVQIDANVDGSVYDPDNGQFETPLGTHNGVDPTEGVSPDGATKIYVRSITFTGIAQQGALNLNNLNVSTPRWMNYAGTGTLDNWQSVTIYDGLRDGYEGTENAVSYSETVTGLNPEIISSSGNQTPGVTNKTRNMFVTNALSDGIYVIPSGERVRMTIVYDVETAVEDLPGVLSDGVTHGTSIENRISTDLATADGPLILQGGKSYVLKLHLGMNSVKFDATVEEWPEEADVEIHVPSTSRPTLFTITAEDILNNRGNEDNPRAWVICEDGHLHLCQNGYEVASDSDPDAPKYLMWDGTGTWEDSDKHNLLTQDDAPDEHNPLSCHKRKTAVVCYVGRTGLVETSPSANGSSAYHGLAIMLEDVNEGPGNQWFTQNGGECVTSYAIGLGESIASSSAYLLTGIDNTNKLIAEGQGADPHSHDAAELITLVYDADVWLPSSDQWCHTPPPGASQWFLPTIGQWNMIVRGLAATRTDLKFGQKLVEGDDEPLYSNEEFSAANLNKYIEKAAGGYPLGLTSSEEEKPSSNAYWSSTEFDEMGSDNHWAWSYNFQYGFAQAWDKVEKLFVRPVLAF